MDERREVVAEEVVEQGVLEEGKALLPHQTAAKNVVDPAIDPRSLPRRVVRQGDTDGWLDANQESRTTGRPLPLSKGGEDYSYIICLCGITVLVIGLVIMVIVLVELYG